MTIDEAIELHKEEATILTNGDNRQIAEWLEDYKQLKEYANTEPYIRGYKKGKSDEYARIIGFLKWCRFCVVDNNGDYYSIEEIERQLKNAGGENAEVNTGQSEDCSARK